MKKLVIAAGALMATTALAQTPPAPPVPPAPIAHPDHDRTTTRAEVVERVREHFGRLDSNKDGVVTQEEAMEGRMEFGKRLKGAHWERAEGGAPNMLAHGGPMGDPNAAFDRLDANKDGSISRDEFAKAREKRIERRIVMRERREEGDAMPKDSKKVRKHVMRMHRGGPFGAHMIVMADADKDGKITQAEAEALALQHFDQMDANRDGQVTREERRTGRPMIIKHMEEKKGGS